MWGPYENQTIQNASYGGVDERNGTRDWRFFGSAGPANGQALSGCAGSGGSRTCARADWAAIQCAGPGRASGCRATIAARSRYISGPGASATACNGAGSTAVHKLASGAVE